jgi:hypothetical protein
LVDVSSPHGGKKLVPGFRHPLVHIRLYELLTGVVPQVEPYSIDEMFMDYRGLSGDLVVSVPIYERQ